MRTFTVTMADKDVYGDDYDRWDVAAAVLGLHLFADVLVEEVSGE
jgi:hypothetical protein